MSSAGEVTVNQVSWSSSMVFAPSMATDFWEKPSFDYFAIFNNQWVNVRTTAFGDFGQYSAEKMPFSCKQLLG
jgi:hypothetical protein